MIAERGGKACGGEIVIIQLRGRESVFIPSMIRHSGFNCYCNVMLCFLTVQAVFAIQGPGVYSASNRNEYQKH
jgi:hypothetical protein